jgi:RHS repeat-associated protein
MRASTRKVPFPWLVLGAAAAILLGVTSRAHAQAGQEVEYYALDAVGSVRVVFDANGVVKGRMDYAPFGEELYSGLFMPSERFAQLTRDGEAGLDYAQARMYQPRTGRFNAVDSVYVGLFDPQAWNRYSYAFSKPLNLTDPSGLCPECYDGYTYTETVTVTGSLAYDGVTFTGRYAGGFFGDDDSLADIEGTGQDVDDPSGGGESGAGGPGPNCTPEGPHDCLLTGTIPGLPLPPLARLPAVLPNIASKLPKSWLPSLRRLGVFPTKLNRAGQPQFYDPATGRYLSHLAPLWQNPSQFIVGVTEGAFGTPGTTMPGAVTTARSWGQLIGQALGTGWGLR